MKVPWWGKQVAAFLEMVWAKDLGQELFYFVFWSTQTKTGQKDAFGITWWRFLHFEVIVAVLNASYVVAKDDLKIQAWIFQVFFRYCLNSAQNCDVNFVFHFSVQIHDFPLYSSSFAIFDFFWFWGVQQNDKSLANLKRFCFSCTKIKLTEGAFISHTGPCSQLFAAQICF